MKRKGLVAFIVYALSAIAMALPFVDGRLWLIGWVAYAPIMYCELNRDKSEAHPMLKAWGRGVLFFFIFGLTVFHWLWSLYPMDFAGFDKTTGAIIVILGWIGIPLLQGLVSAFNLVIVNFCIRKDVNRKLIPITAAFTWIAAEWLQTLTWAGIPWAKLAVGQTHLAVNIQTASLFGSYFISFLMILTSGILAIGLMKFKETGRVKKALPNLILAIAVIVSNAAYGLIVTNMDSSENEKTVKIAAMQPNIMTVDKWSEDPQHIFDEYKDLTIESAEAGADLVIWPETALPYVLNADEELVEYVKSISKDAKAEILVGCLYFDPLQYNLRNATTLVSGDSISSDVYYKQKPVPFGEFVPMSEFITSVLPFLSDISMLENDIAAGSNSVVFETDVGKVGSLICFDSIYESLALDSVRNGAEIIAISTNDAWFRDSRATVHHTAQAQLRAVETGRYVVRSGNTGISAIINNYGEIEERLGALEQGCVIGEAKPLSHKTLYATIGNLIVFVAYLYLALMLFKLTFGTKKLVRDIKAGAN